MNKNQEPRVQSQEVTIVRPGNEKRKYHIQIPQDHFPNKYPEWKTLSRHSKMRLMETEFRLAIKFLEGNEQFIFSSFHDQYPNWKIELIQAPETAYRQIVESLGRMLRQQPEITVHTSSDLGAEILALTKDKKEVSDE